jgi:hypothetical protein
MIGRGHSVFNPQSINPLNPSLRFVFNHTIHQSRESQSVFQFVFFQKKIPKFVVPFRREFL